MAGTLCSTCLREGSPQKPLSQPKKDAFFPWESTGHLRKCWQGIEHQTGAVWLLGSSRWGWGYLGILLELGYVCCFSKWRSPLLVFKGKPRRIPTIVRVPFRKKVGKLVGPTTVHVCYFPDRCFALVFVAVSHEPKRTRRF